MSGRNNSGRRGFTLVEIVIVITVIGLLAVLVLTTYSAAQKRAKDTRRLMDISSISKALKAYKAEHEEYPDATSSVSGAWDASSDNVNGHVFLKNLVDSGVMPHPPKDPINTSLDGQNTTGYHYAYYSYPPDGTLAGMGCDTSRGKLVILVIRDLESTTGVHPDSPGFSCSGRNWEDEAEWVWGDYDE